MLDRIDHWMEGQVAQGQRQLVHHLVGRRFGIGAEARLRPILEGISDPACIKAVADAVIECDSAEALIARAKEVAGS